MGLKARNLISLATIYIIVVSLILAGTYWGSAITSAVVQSLPVPRKQTIVIDPGHGGEDGGAVSEDGTSESGINLEIALKLNDLLRFFGQKTAMIRTDDVSVNTPGLATFHQRKSLNFLSMSLPNKTQAAAQHPARKANVIKSLTLLGPDFFKGTVTGLRTAKTGLSC